jgi:hypothetical protein
VLSQAGAEKGAPDAYTAACQHRPCHVPPGVFRAPQKSILGTGPSNTTCSALSGPTVRASEHLSPRAPVIKIAANHLVAAVRIAQSRHALHDLPTMALKVITERCQQVPGPPSALSYGRQALEVYCHHQQACCRNLRSQGVNRLAALGQPPGALGKLFGKRFMGVSLTLRLFGLGSK